MTTSEPIAIVGIGCRLPGGVTSPDELWALLVAGKDVVCPIPEERSGSAHARVPAYGGYLDDVWGFDAAFFGMSPRDAEAIDPQQRLLLQTTWEALEDAAVPPSALAGSSTGVFVGLFSNDYALYGGDRGMLGHVGSARSGAAARITYAFDLCGPCSVVDTDRSSGLVALENACASLRAGECDTAIVGAASVILDPAVSLAFHEAGLLAPDGRCKFADERADGFVRSEGVVSLVLRPLRRALAEPGPVYAVVRGGAVMASGRLGGDLMAQSPEAQARLLAHAYERAGVSPRDLTYVEAHGTGTPRGDEAELLALGRILRGVGRTSPCWIGSIKTNLGHTEPCAGLAGVVKVCLAASRGVLPPSLHFRSFPSSVAGEPLRVVVGEPVRVDVASFVAGVSALGLTGINAHVVISSAPPHARSSAGPSAPGETGHSAQAAPVLCLSAADDAGLRAMALRHADRLERGDLSLHDACRSAALHRDHLRRRAALVVRTREEAVAELRKFANGGAADGSLVVGTTAWTAGDEIVFVFPGQGSQWPGMGRGLLRESAAFARTMEECDAAMRGIAGWSILEELESAAHFDRIDVVQPLLVAMEVALAAMWRSWGIAPSVVVGTSMGEAAAACVAGALGLSDALRVIHARTCLMRTVGGGRMAVVDLPAARILPRLDPRLVSVAAINSATSTVISGERATVEGLVAAFEREGAFARIVRVDVASHSPEMDPILDPLRAALAGIAPHDEDVPFYSTVHGRYVKGRELTAEYWVQNLRRPVNLAGAVQALAGARASVFLEISPHPVLRSPILDSVQGGNRPRAVLFTLERDADELIAAKTTLGRLHVCGSPVPWKRHFGPGPAARLPTYAWSNRRLRGASRASRDQESKPGTAASNSPVTSLDATWATPAPAPAAEDASLLSRLRAAPAAGRARMLREALANELARVLKIAAVDVDHDLPLRDHGLTSASGTELRVTLGEWFARSFPSSVLFDHPTIRALAAHIADELQPPRAARAGESPGEPDSSRRPPAAGSTATPARAAGASRSSEPLAVVGLAFRFPGGVRCLESLWHLLREGRDAITEVPPDRWDAARLYDRDVRAKGKMHTRWGGFVEDVACFDADLFGVSPVEAQSMDPQQRMLLELSWEALEDAGTSRSRVMGSGTGVFVGIMNNNEYARRRRGLDDVPLHASTGDATSVAAGRISYFFGLHGPALAIDTACSSSLVALHLAAESLRSGECESALVAGVNVIAHPATTLAFAKTRMLSPTGRCRTFDAAADGYVRGEGGCVLLLKPLGRAIADGDRVHIVVRGTAVNQDGRGSGLTAPNGKAQEALVTGALANAGLRPADVSYVEAHGTGTPLGDPVEVHALARVFGASRSLEDPLIVGAAKANLGHLEACAGLAGIAKVIAAMRARKIPPQPHLKTPNPKLDAPGWMIFPREEIAWNPPSKRLVAGVSSFGFSGTNAHVIVEEPPAASESPATPGAPVVFPVSAANAEVLADLARSYATSAALQLADCEVANVAASAARREHLPVRAALVAGSMASLREQLGALADRRVAAGLVGPHSSVRTPTVGFMYGAGKVFDSSAGGALYASESAFRAAVDCCAEAARMPFGEWLAQGSAELSPRERGAALFALQAGLTAIWASWGVVAEHVVGVGIGEYAAAYTAGVLDLDGALALLLDGDRATVAVRPPTVGFCAGRATDASPFELAYWTAAAPPREEDAQTLLARAGCKVLVTIGPDDAVVRRAQRALGPSMDCISSTGEEPIATTLARLYVSGVDVHWRTFYGGRAARRHPLPPYPFARRVYWIGDRSHE